MFPTVSSNHALERGRCQTRLPLVPARAGRFLVSKRIAVIVPLLAAGALAAVLLVPSGPSKESKFRPTLRPARAAAKAGDWKEAEALAEVFLRERPGDTNALLLAGEAAARQDRFPAAIRHYDAVGDAAGTDAAVARLCAGDLRLKLGRLTEAERDFRHAIELDPTQTRARSRLAIVLMLSGRRWEAGPYLLEMVREDDAGLDELCALGDPDRLMTNDEQLASYRDLAPSDPLPALGVAARLQRIEDAAKAERLLAQIVEEHPQLIEAQVRLGEQLARDGESERFLAWHRQLSIEAEQHPQLWYVRGMFSMERGAAEAAARCFWEALRREPNHLGATYQLGQTLARLGRSEEASRLGERARKLQRVTASLKQLHERPHQIDEIRETFGLFRDLGRLWEARAWLQVAIVVEKDAEWIRSEQDLFYSSSEWEPQQTASIAAPAAWLDCSSYPLPEWASTASDRRDVPRVASAESAIRFEPADVGINFSYFSSPDTSTPGVRMQEFTGGGVGAVDFDGDSRPDLYFPQGCEWPPDLEQRTHLDRLYRNIGVGFIDVTSNAGVIEPGFSQGVAAGDFDGDGFQDLYVANIGGNRLFVNNGDGTFRDITSRSGIDAGPVTDAWTISAAVADLNGDALPDLYDVNYVEGERVYEMLCGEGDEARACSPSAFQGTPDRLLINRGDGTFENVTTVSGITAPNGTGMGVVAADFDGSGRLSLFISNDLQANHFYANRTSASQGPPTFEEQALLNGLAYDRDGRPQACMGIAAGDSDSDGRLDLFVTNYINESNVLYRQSSDGLFADETRAAGLTEPSFDVLGFGTQFLDADLDGEEDLVVANGHIDDFTHDSLAYRMRPQFFRNVGGRFEELSATTLGPYFDQKLLGRGLARFDWNADGRDDFAVSHLQDPAALLTNATANSGRSVTIRLRATNSARDAIGTTVTVEAGERRFVKQLTAGDGYAASNERKLVFGLGEREQADRVVVRWPSGSNVKFAELPAGTGWLLVEERAPLKLSAP